MDDREELSALRRLAELEAKAESRRTPKQMIGAEGFSQAMRSTLEEHPVAGRAAAFGAFPRQLYEGAKQIVGQGDPTAIRATRVMEETYPGAALAGGLSTVALSALAPGASTIAGQAALGGATGAAMPTEGEESRVKNALVGGALGGGVAAGLKGLGMGASKLLGRETSKAADTASEHAVRTQTIKDAQELGLKLPPTVTGGGRIAKGLESVAGKAAVAQQASIDNQQVINRVARTEAGLPTNAPLTEANLAATRNTLAEPYREVERLAAGHPLTQPPFKPAGETLQELRQVRNDAKRQWDYYKRSANPESFDKATALDSKAELLEDSIDAIAQHLGDPKLLERLRDARVKLAKNFTVQNTLNIGDGNVDASVIGKILDKKGEKALSGGLLTIGKFQQAFPSFAREAPTGQSAPGVGYLKYPLALALGAEGYNLGQQHGIGPYGTAAGLLALAGGPARSVALSKMMQSAPKYQPGMAVRLSDLATNDPRLRSMIPLSATAAALQPDRQ